MDAVILQALENIRCGFLDVFFSIFTLLGEEMVVAGIIAVIYICFKKSLGERAIVTVLSASCLTTGIKSAVQRPRPYVAGDVEKVDNFLTEGLDETMSFPSGHATASSGFFATLAFSVKKLTYILLCVLFVLLVAFSRLYLGVHYPSDVLTGLLIGTGMAIIWHFIYKGAYRARLYIYLGVAIAACAVLFIPSMQTKSMYEMAGVALATAIGLLIEEKCVRFDDADRWWKRGVRLLVMAIVAAVPYLLLSLLPEQILWFKFLQYFVTIFATITLVPLLIKKLRI